MWKLLLLGIVLSVLVYYIIVRLGIRNIKADYKRDYEALVRAVREYKVTYRNRRVIENKFKAIEKYKCRDKKRLDDLLSEFNDKFRVELEKTEVIEFHNGDVTLTQV